MKIITIIWVMLLVSGSLFAQDPKKETKTDSVKRKSQKRKETSRWKPTGGSE